MQRPRMHEILPSCPICIFAWQERQSYVAILGAFAKLRNTTINFVMSVCLPVCPFVRPSVRNNLAATGKSFVKIRI